MQSKIGSKKNFSYYGFLNAIGEENIPSFDDRQVALINYLSDMLPLVRPYEYVIVNSILDGAGSRKYSEIEEYAKTNINHYSKDALDHAIHYMIHNGYFTQIDNELTLDNVNLTAELDEYLRDLTEYGLGKYDIDFGDMKEGELFHLWRTYKKEQVQQLLLNNPKDIMLGTKIYDGVVYIYVTVIKGDAVKATLKYEDGYLDQKTFRWETVANVSEKELNNLKNSKKAHVFVRKVDNEDGIQLPFTYIGEGKLEYIEGSKKLNGAHWFRIPMDAEAPEDVYFDFKLPG